MTGQRIASIGFIISLALTVLVGVVPVHAQMDLELAALNQKVEQLNRDGRNAEAISLAERYVSLARDRYGEEHTEFAEAITQLADLYVLQDDLEKAEPLFRRALTIFEVSHGFDHPDVAAVLDRLAGLLQVANRLNDAEPLYRRALAIYEKQYGPDDLHVAAALHHLARVLQDIDRTAEAEGFFRRALKISENRSGLEHPTTAIHLYNLAALLSRTKRLAEAEPIYLRSLAIREKVFGRDSAKVVGLLQTLSNFYFDQQRIDEAEAFKKRYVAIEAPYYTARSKLNNEAGSLAEAGRYSEALLVAERAKSFSENYIYDVFDHVVLLKNLAWLYEKQGRDGDSELTYKRAINIFETTLKEINSVRYVPTIHGLARLYIKQKRYPEAEQLYQRVHARFPYNDGWGYGDLPELYRLLGRYDEAKSLYERILDGRKKFLGPKNTEVATILKQLAGIEIARKSWDQAIVHLEQAKSISVDNAHRAAKVSPKLLGLGWGDMDLVVTMDSWSDRLDQIAWEPSDRTALSWLVQASMRRAESEPARLNGVVREQLLTTQLWHDSAAGVALAQMAARVALARPELSDLAREHQTLAEKLQEINKKMYKYLLEDVQGIDSERKQLTTDGLQATTALIDIDRRLAAELPKYLTLANPDPSTVEEIQKLLASNEVLVQMLNTDAWETLPEETIIWFVSKTGSPRLVRSKLGTKALTESVAKLRCGLDEEEWALASAARRCGDLLRLTDMPESSRPLPFDLEIAYGLYRELFGEAEDLIKGKRLLIVPTGPLTSLPFHLLVTRPSKSSALPEKFEGYRNVAWLARSHSLAVLPAISSLKALRESAVSGAKPTRDYIGYGDPVLQGDRVTCRDAITPNRCPGPSRLTSVSAGAAATDRATIGGDGRRRSGDAQTVLEKDIGTATVLNQVRSLCPLPETAYEIKCVADDFRTTQIRFGSAATATDIKNTQIRLGRDATEVDIKNLSRSGELATYRVVHFATHGLLSGDVELMAKRQSEPALVMTPPNAPQENDPDYDGLLTASEVAQLNLNADWVVLSACNTAAGETIGAEALSGLARAFFYAGARALLVSHWPVYSEAAVKLTTATFANLGRNPEAGHADALRRAMVEVMNDRSQASNAHPAVWAPFFVVGEGSR